MARIAGCAAAFLLLATVIILQFTGATGSGAHDVLPGPENPVLGLDMFPDAANTAGSLGTIDRCVQVANQAGSRFEVDAWLDAIPLDEDAAGFNYVLYFPESAMRILGQSHAFMFHDGVDISQGVPDESSPHLVTVAMLDTPALPGGLNGVLGRYAFEVRSGASDGLYSLAFDRARGLVTFVNSADIDWWYGPDLLAGTPDDKGADVWDGDHSPQYGLIALGSASCPGAAPSVTPAPPGPPTPTPVPPVDCGGVLATIVGTEGPDVIVGTDQRDFVAALGGDDEISGLGAWDVICGGEGNDVIDAGGGYDLVYGGGGNDVIEGASGNDVLDGGPGDDTIKGGQGADMLYGGDGNDTLAGQAGDDYLTGDWGFDVCRGGPGTEYLEGACEASTQ